ncbi:MAG: deoxyribonuclease IV [Patescibacteria group bacterium]
MRIGCHVSIAGGITNAPQRAADLGCEVFQIFTRSPQGGPAPKITPEIIKEFKSEMEKRGQNDCYIHTPYYINFASVKESTRKLSSKIVREELERGSLIGAKYVMTHLGSSASLAANGIEDTGKEDALKITAEGVANILEGYDGSTQLLLEISAGAGETIGDTFEELDFIINGDKRLGVCLDSAHMFASGYDIVSSTGFKKVISEIERTVGMDAVKLIHSNDSKVGLGEKKDRHEHIGMGKIGKVGFENFISVFKNIDFIMETQHDLAEKDIAVLKSIRMSKDIRHKN